MILLTPLAMIPVGAWEALNTVRLTKEFFAKEGSKGGKKAAQGMTKQQRIERARKAAKARASKGGPR